MKQKMYGLTRDPSREGYDFGPDSDPQRLAGGHGGPDYDGAEIHLLNPNGSPTVVYVHHNGEWKRNKVPDAIFDPKPFEDTPARQLVLGAMEIEGEQNEVVQVRVEVKGFWIDSMIKPADYEQVKIHGEFIPENYRTIYVNVTNPGQLVDNAGNVRLFGHVLRYIAREIDRSGFRVASERVDRRTVEQDKQDEKKGGVKLGNAPKRSEVL